MPKVSFVVPIYKSEKVIHRCINSIIAQTFEDWEAILIDDGSPDNCGIICDKYAAKDTRIKVIHKINGGVSAARNTGLDKVTGEWVCCVDSDDFIAPTYLEDFGFTRYEADLYAQGYKYYVNSVNSGAFTFKNNEIGLKSLKDAYHLLENNDIINSPVFKLYKNSIIKTQKLRFSTETSYGEDHIFSIRYLYHVNNIYFSSRDGYNIDKSNEKSLSRRAVPYNDISFYIPTICSLIIGLLVKNGWTIDALIQNAVATRFYRNWIRVIKDTVRASNKEQYFDFYSKTKEFCSYNRSLPMYSKCFLKLYTILPPSVTYYLFKLFLHY